MKFDIELDGNFCVQKNKVYCPNLWRESKFCSYFTTYLAASPDNSTYWRCPDCLAEEKRQESEEA